MAACLQQQLRPGASPAYRAYRLVAQDKAKKFLEAAKSEQRKIKDEEVVNYFCQCLAFCWLSPANITVATKFILAAAAAATA